MRYLELQQQLKSFTVFGLSDIHLLEPNFDSRRLVEWQAKGYLIKLRRGYYAFADQATQLGEAGLFLMANRIYEPAYVSLESALSYYNIIPESVFTITSVSARKTQQFKTPVGSFAYRSVKPGLFWGFGIHRFQGQPYKLATLEKALLDFLYFREDLKSQVNVRMLRFNEIELRQQLDFCRLDKYAAAFGSTALQSRLALVLSLFE